MVSNHIITLIDFGGAKMRFTSLSQRPTYLWSPGYGAPEQQSGEYYFQSDIYGVGATMYFLLTGEHPCTLPPLSPRSENPQITHELDRIVQMATFMDPDQRFQTATEMKENLLGVYKPNLEYNPRIIVGSKEYQIKDSLTIGRGGGKVCPDVVINDPEKYVSKIHARIVADGSDHWIERHSESSTVN
jgi:serine/threonine protein kinase